jgi:hypothetical protein
VIKAILETTEKTRMTQQKTDDPREKVLECTEKYNYQNIKLTACTHNRGKNH